MNKFLEMLDSIENRIVKEDVSFEGYYYEEETDTTIYDSLEIDNNGDYNMDSAFKDVTTNLHDVSVLHIDCDTNEIDYITYFDSGDEEHDEEPHELEIRQLILDSLTADELELYHNKCKVVIAKCIELWNEGRRS